MLNVTTSVDSFKNHFARPPAHHFGFLLLYVYIRMKKFMFTVVISQGQKDTEVSVLEREASLFEASGVRAAKALAGAPDGLKKQAIEAVPKSAEEENREVKVGKLLS